MFLFKLFLFFFIPLQNSFSHDTKMVSLQELVTDSQAILIVKAENPLFTFEKVSLSAENTLPFKKRILRVRVQEILKKKDGVSLEPNTSLELPSRYWQYDLAAASHSAQYKEKFSLPKLSYSGLGEKKLKERPFILFVFGRLSPLNLTGETADQLYYMEGGFETIEKKTEIYEILNRGTKEKN